MNMDQINATITLTLTKEQLIQLLTGATTPTQTTQTTQTTQATATATPTQTTQTTATQTQSYSVQDLMLAARPLAESGRQQELIAMLVEFGVPSVAAIPEDKRADFAARLRAMGGQI